MMKAIVNSNCIGCGLCANACPAVFEMGDDNLAHADVIPVSQVDTAQEARDSCPVDAITIEG